MSIFNSSALTLIQYLVSFWFQREKIEGSAGVTLQVTYNVSMYITQDHFMEGKIQHNLSRRVLAQSVKTTDMMDLDGTKIQEILSHYLHYLPL